jgi:HNH endonuclease/NUMOD4 motif-containing protein
MAEQWLPVPQFARYEVSDLGRVRTWFNSRNVKQSEPLLLAPWRKTGRRGMDSDYRLVVLRRDGKSFKRYVHRLVLEAFVGPAPKGKVARHFPDRTPSNCTLSNLRWGTMIENSADKLAQGSRIGRPRGTHCVNGHRLEPANTLMARDGRGNPYQACRTCGRERMRAHRARSHQ